MVNYIKLVFVLLISTSIIFIFPYNLGENFSSFVYADSNDNTDIPKTVPVGVSEMKGSICGAISPKDSLVMSIITMCLPGILEKTYEWRQIKCETVHCYYNAVKYSNLDPQICIKQKAYRECKYIVGEFSIFTKIFDNIREIIASIISNPQAILLSIGTQYMRHALKNCVTPQCSGLSPIAISLAFIDIAGAYQTIKEIFDNGFNFNLKVQDSCSGIDKIKEEMNEILNAGGNAPGVGQSNSINEVMANLGNSTSSN